MEQAEHVEREAAKALINFVEAASVYAERRRREFLRRLAGRRVKGSFRTDDGSFDLPAFKACLKDNGIEPPKVDMERHGAIGRFRMCAGLTLRRHEKAWLCGNRREENHGARREEAIRTQGEGGSGVENNPRSARR